VRYAIDRDAHLAATQTRPNAIERAHHAFDAAFERFRSAYRGALETMLRHARPTVIWFAAFTVVSLVLVPFVGEDFFPLVDAGQLRVHLRAPAGTRLEETEQIAAAVERSIRQVIPPSDLAFILDNVGISTGGSNLAMSDNPPIGATDGEIDI